MRLLVVTCLVVTSTACSIARDTPAEASVCQLLADPSFYVGKLIVLRAVVESDGLHLTLLTDEACSGAGIGLVVDDDIADGEAAVAMSRAIATQRFGAPSKQIKGTFTGIFRLRPGKVPSRVLLTRAISNVQISDSGQS